MKNSFTIQVSWWKYYIYDTQNKFHVAEFNSLREAIAGLKELQRVEAETEWTNDSSALSQWKI